MQITHKFFNKLMTALIHFGPETILGSGFTATLFSVILPFSVMPSNH